MFICLGAKPLGPKGPRALFYMLPKQYRVQGLCTALSFKYAQNNLHIVDSLEIPTDDPEVLLDFMMFSYLKYMYKSITFFVQYSLWKEKTNFWIKLASTCKKKKLNQVRTFYNLTFWWMRNLSNLYYFCFFQYIKDLIDTRFLGFSALFVDEYVLTFFWHMDIFLIRNRNWQLFPYNFTKNLSVLFDH